MFECIADSRKQASGQLCSAHRIPGEPFVMASISTCLHLRHQNKIDHCDKPALFVTEKAPTHLVTKAYYDWAVWKISTFSVSSTWVSVCVW